MGRLAVVVALVAVVGSGALAGACSSGSGLPGGGPSAAQACADNAHERCVRLEACSATDLALRYGSEGACESREAHDCVLSLSAPLNGNAAAAVEACAGAYAGWSCGDYLDDENVPPACQQQLGPVIGGGPCAIDGQCESGFCALAPGLACGKCAPLPAAGASCALLTSCGPGLTCTADTARCVPFGLRDAACGKDAPCGVGLSCVGADATAGTAGRCEAAVAAVGSKCDPTEKNGAGCDRNAGLTCNSGSKTCEPVVVAASGQPCGSVGDQAVYCQTEGVCAGATATMPGTCRAAAADGAACDTATGPGCVIPARCITGGDSGTAGTCQYSPAQTCH